MRQINNIKLHSKALIGAALVTTMATSVPAMAESDYYDSAKVTKVESITETVRVSTPRRECRTEPVTREYETYHDSRPRGRSFTAEILGAVIGAGVGRQFGNGRGQDAATVAGAVLGASVGRDIKRRHYNNKGDYVSRRSHVEHVEVCERVDDYHTEERIVGYRVQYRYNGRLYWTQTDYEPGETIDVHVSVVPAS